LRQEATVWDLPAIYKQIKSSDFFVTLTHFLCRSHSRKIPLFANLLASSRGDKSLRELC
jgi:hypothetical protein